MYTFDASIVSDLHKDAYGFRPSTFFWEKWSHASDDQKQKIWDSLCDSLERAVNEEKRAQDAAVAWYNSQLSILIRTGAFDENQAKRWIVQGLNPCANDLRYGGEWVCFQLGLPYSMSTQFDQVCQELLQQKEQDDDEQASI